MAFLLNILWFVLGGLVMGLGWWLAGLICAITIVGIPWARSCFVIGNFSFWPFGQEAIGHLTSALACFVTIIGIAFGIQHSKLALIAFAPIGMQVVPRRR